MNPVRRLYLASSSKGRVQLLRQAGWQPTAASYHAHENMRADEATSAAVQRLAQMKLDCFLRHHPLPANRPVVAADTLLDCAGQHLGKPRSREHAAEMLGMLAGCQHTVHTAVAAYGKGGTTQFYDQATVTIRAMDSAAIDVYLALEQWGGAAGAYRLQQAGLGLISTLTGSPSTVVGLPMHLLLPWLESHMSQVSVR